MRPIASAGRVAPASRGALARERITVLRRFGVLDTSPEQAFDDLTSLAAELCAAPMALVSLVDENRQWFKSRIGVELCETPLEQSFCAHALGGPELLVVEDAHEDQRFAANPLVVGAPGIRFYAGAPLVAASGHVVGTLCVLDVVRRSLSAVQRAQLALLARQVVSQLELRGQAIALAEEVAARTTAESAHRESQRLLDAVLDHTDVVVYAKDLEGRFVLANPALHALIGRAGDTVLGRTDAELFPEADTETFRRHDLEIVARGAPDTFPEELRLPDGTVRSYLSTKFPLRDDADRIYAVAGVSTDVTELAAARRDHAESEQRWRALVEHSPVAVAVIGADARFVYANPQALALYGARDSADLAGRLAMEFVPAGADDETSRLFGALLEGGPAVMGHRWTLRRLDGELVAVDINAAAVTHLGRPAVQVELRDMRERVAAEEAMRGVRDELEARQVFTDAVLDSVDVGIVACDADGHLTVFNDATKAWHGVDLKANPVKAADPEHFASAFDLHDADGRLLDSEQIPLLRALRDGAVQDAEMVITPHGRPSTRVVCSGRTLATADGRPLGAVVAMTDITVARAQSLALQASEQRFRTTFANHSAGLAVLSRTGKALQVNPAFCRLTGHGESDLLATDDLMHLLVAEDRTALVTLMRDALTDPGATVSTERKVLRASGQERWALLTLTELPDPQEGTCLLLQAEDITDRKTAEQLLTRQALYDSLTGLPNRTLLIDRTAKALARVSRRPDDGLIALLFCDLDGFKAINDAGGHAAGDHVLSEVGRRLAEVVRPTDTVARLGGDEFVVLCEHLPSREEVPEIVARIEQAVGVPVDWDGGALSVTASVGVAYGAATLSAEELVRQADTAMYQAKRLGKNRVEFFDEELRTRSTSRVRVERELRAALDSDAIEVHYQPIFALPERRIVAVEALARLRLPDGTLGMPDVFIPVAEDTDLIVALGDSVLRRACQQLARWSSALGREIQVSVNLSAREAARPDLCARVRQALADAGLPASALALELTESVLLEAARSTLGKLQELRQSGVSIGIDDFGTGYASLRYLSELPVSFLKVDRQFVAGMTTNHRDEVIVLTVAKLAADLGLGCVVEGVETPAQLARIADTGAHVQGYLLGRPESADDTTEVLRRNHAD